MTVPIEQGEFIYRRVKAQDHIRGKRVLPGAVEFPESSVDRSRYSTAKESLDRASHGEDAIVSIQVCRLPAIVSLSSGRFCYQVYWTPTHRNSNPNWAHCDLWALPLDRPPPDAFNGLEDEERNEIRQAIACLMQVEIKPGGKRPR